MKATIVYQSRRGKTAFYARNMAMYLWQKGWNVSLCATSDFKEEKLVDCDLLMLGCWTSGWFVVNQHPNPIWVDFARQHMQVRLPKRVLLFTTYKIHTGSMFRRMMKEMDMQAVEQVEKLKSKTGILSEHDRQVLDNMTIQKQTFND